VVVSPFFVRRRVQVSIWFWILFNLFIVGMLALDLGVFHRRAHEVGIKEAAIWSGVWITLSLLFNLGIYIFAGSEHARAFLTGYLIEKALSVDNIFVMVLIFGYFGVAPKYQHRVLFWGIIGALVMRGIFIVLGSVLLQAFHWVMYFFGALLVITGTRMAFREEKPFDAEDNKLLRLARKLIPVTPQYHGQHFLTRISGRFYATPLLLVLILVEFTDLVFAIDSIPAVFAVTTNAFLVYTSNIFAILGLRSLYFLLAGIVHKFRYLKYGLAFILVFVGVKMLLSEIQEVPIIASLVVIALSLIVSIAVSLIIPETHDALDIDEAPPAEPTQVPQQTRAS
jgi:tellurite resistance protein TerC